MLSHCDHKKTKKKLFLLKHNFDTLWYIIFFYVVSIYIILAILVPLLARRYEYLEVIGRGGSSITIRARDTFRPDDCQVAIKILNVNYYRLGYQVNRTNWLDAAVGSSQGIRWAVFWVDSFCVFFFFSFFVSFYLGFVLSWLWNTKK